jgi:hypothetical protein
MPDPSSPAAAQSVSRDKILLLPGSKFFVRRCPLVPGQGVEAQAELLLETIGPFAPGQLYYGCHVSPAGTELLVFAAYRRNFPATEIAAWAAAEAVLPAFVFWLGQSAPASPEVWVHERGGDLVALMWDGQGALPAGILGREVAAPAATAGREDLVREARRRLMAPQAEVRTFRGDPVAGALTKQGLTFALGERTATFTAGQLRALDIREKSELAGREVRGRRDQRLWAAFAAAIGLLAACVAGELGLFTGRTLLGRQRARLEAAGNEVRRIEQANQLVVRLEQLAGQSLRPLEMLALLNASRPATLEFVRAATTGPRQMEIEAQAGNAIDPSVYEQALAKTAEIEKVELRDFRTAGGRTTFLVAITFKPGFAGNGGAR